MAILKVYNDHLIELLKQENLIIIDVREPEEFEGGHLPKAVNYPLSQLHEREIPDHSDVLFYCRAGYRSQIVAEFFVQHHHNNLKYKCYDYKDGYLGYQRLLASEKL